jgi:hypothetical protein
MRSTAALLALSLAVPAVASAQGYPRSRRWEPPEAPHRVTTVLSLALSGAPEGGAAGVGLVIDGRRGGFQASIDAVGSDALSDDPALDGTAAIGWGTMHATFALASDPYLRLRLELGGSMLSMPDSGALAGRRYAGDVAFGPSLGASGRLRLAGPLGLEGHLRVTPLPVPVGDARLALALRGGPVAFTFGWRALTVAGDEVDAPELRVNGVEVGLALVF